MSSVTQSFPCSVTAAVQLLQADFKMYRRWLVLDSFIITGVVKFFYKLLFVKMCKNFKLSRCDKKTFCFFRLRSKKSFKRFLPGKSCFTRTDQHLRSDQEICIPSAREVLQPIYVTEITRNFPSEILMPFASARNELGEINFFRNGNREKCLLGESDISVDSEQNAITEIFAWVYSMDTTEENFPDDLSATTSVYKN